MLPRCAVFGEKNKSFSSSSSSSCSPSSSPASSLFRASAGQPHPLSHSADLPHSLVHLIRRRRVNRVPIILFLRRIYRFLVFRRINSLSPIPSNRLLLFRRINRLSPIPSNASSSSSPPPSPAAFYRSLFVSGLLPRSGGVLCGATLASAMALQQELLQRAEGAGPLLRAALAQGEAEWKQASSAQAARLVELVGLVRPQGQLLIRLAGQVQQSNFAPADAQQFSDALAAVATSNVGGSWKAQDFSNFPYFLSDEVWAALNAPSGDVLHMARIVLSFLSKLGLKTASEGTMAHVTALVLICAEGAPRARAMANHFLKETFDHIKSMWKGMVKPAPLEMVPALPADPNAFRAAHPATWTAVYGDGSPASIQVSFVDVSVVAKAFRWRDRSAGSTPVMGVMQALQQVIGQALPQQERLANGGVLTYSGQQPRSLAGVHAASMAAAGQLAFTDFQQQQQQLQDQQDHDLQLQVQQLQEQLQKQQRQPQPQPQQQAHSAAVLSIEDASVGHSADASEGAAAAKKGKAVEHAAMHVAAAMQQEKESKAKAKAKAQPKTKVLKRPAAAPSGQPGKVTKISVENTRSQCVAHYGRGPGSTKQFKWGPSTGFTKEKAKKAAEQWIKHRLSID